MNCYLLIHEPQSGLAYALSENTLRIVLCVGKEERPEEIVLLYNNKYDFAARRFEAPMQKVATGPLCDYYVADVTLTDVRFAYLFRLQSGGQEYYFTENGLVEGGNVAKHPFFQFPYLSAADVVKAVPWTKDAVFYQIFVDRFCRGDSEKDEGYINIAWGSPVNWYSYAGGDLKGVRQKLEYLRGMGINALYLTPIYTAKSNHKYNIENYTRVDPQFGTMADLSALIASAHELGMKVVTDTVFNHSGADHPYFRDVMEKGKKSAYYDWYIIHGDYPTTSPCNFETFAHSAHMPKWNTSNPAVMDYLISVALEYLSWGFDGLRLDVADEVPQAMWRKLRREVKARFPEAVIIGEVWHENNMYLRGDEFDGVMNYKLYNIFVRYFARGSIGAEEAAEQINRILLRNLRQVNQMMLNFLDNHDTPRFLRLCNEEEEKLKAALACLYFCVGMPCVYYGTELPLTGGGDPDCRRTYDWERTPKLYGYLKQLAEMRSKLCDGDMYAKSENGVLILVRSNQEERAMAYFGGKPQGGDILFETNNVTIVKERL